MELMVISKPILFKGEADLVNQLFGTGLQVFHLRKENATNEVYRKIIEGISPVFHPQIALHHFHELANDYQINRIHHTESYRLQNSDTTLPKKGVLSTSIHQLSKMNDILQYDYSFFGPVFNSLSKPDYPGVISQGFRLDKQVNQPKIIALGGIGLNQIDLVKEMNFDGVALLGSIWNDPSQALSIFKKVQIQCRSYS